MKNLKNWLNNRKIYYGILILLIIFRLWMITGIPKVYYYAPHDDLYFAKIAHSIIHGQWLGAYGYMTLLKAPFFAFFLIASFLTGLPLFFNETLFYIFGCIVLIIAISPLIENKWWKLMLFSFILFSPLSLPNYWILRVYREFVYFSLTLYVVSFSIGLFLRLKEKKLILFRWAIGLGISMGAFMITREEGVWIYPMLFSLLLVGGYSIFKGKFDDKWQRSGILLFPILLWYIPILVVSMINYSHYGFWGISEQLDPEFNRVLNSLDSIKVINEKWHPTIQISQNALEQAYVVSPSFSLLKEEIENIIPSWNIHDDVAMSSKPGWYLDQYGTGGSEVGKGFFLWLIRDAVYIEGYFDDGLYPEEVFSQIADELESACDNGELDCSSSRSLPFVGSIDRRHIPIIIKMFFETFINLLNFNYINPSSLDFSQWGAWTENNWDYKYFEEFTYNPINYLEMNQTSENDELINGKIDLRVRMLPIKEKIINFFYDLYKPLTLPFFVLGIFSMIFFIILTFRFKQKNDLGSFLTIATFLLGLLVFRLLTLSIVDSTTSAPGRLYSISNYNFIFIFIGIIDIKLLVVCLQILKQTFSRKRG